MRAARHDGTSPRRLAILRRMAQTETAEITLVGGGLGGALLATHLGRDGRRVDLYERRPDPLSGAYVAGRSINLAISVRGLHALQEVGLADEVLRHAVPMRGRMIHALGGGLRFQPYDKNPDLCINSISRAMLNNLTLAAARRLPNVRVFFDQRCTEVELDGPTATFQHVETGQTRRVEAPVLIGVDGAYSVVRQAMQRRERCDYQQAYLAHGYKELCIPAGPDGQPRMEPNALHIWPRRSFMMIALPNHDGSFTCTLFYPHEGPRSFAQLRTDDDVRRFFEETFPDAVPLMPSLLEDFRANPVGAMVTVRTAPWHVGGKVALVGDACHAVVPFYGQGANAAFEDCAVLAECVRAANNNWEAAFATYYRRRKENTDALADLALANFIEMRDKSGTTLFQWYKTIDRALHRALPRFYTPLYTLVSFSRTPYATARARGRRQDGFLLIGLMAAMFVLLVAALGWVGRASLSEAVLAALILVLPALAAAARYRRQDQAQLREIGVLQN